MKAIETVYKGYRFRSRLEARWAVYLDTMKIRWQYEPEGLDIDGTWYLPDFRLPSFDRSRRAIWLEIKGREPTEDEIDKASGLARVSNQAVLLFAGTFDNPYPLAFGWFEPGTGRMVSNVTWGLCPYCEGLGSLIIFRDDFLFICNCLPGGCEWMDLGAARVVVFAEELLEARNAARSARFR